MTGVTRTSSVLVVAAAVPDPPFDIAIDGRSEGFDVALMEAIAAEMRLTVRFVPYTGDDFNGIFDGLAGGDYDAVASGTTIAPERRQVAIFSDPYLTFNQGLIISSGAPSTRSVVPGSTDKPGDHDPMAFRLIRMFMGDDGQSHFDVGEVAWQRHDAVNAVSALTAVHEVSFEETAAGSRLDWHNAPCRQYVITLSGRLEFETRGGAVQVVEPGDILLAEDTAGGGHRWRLVDDQPWRRVYVTIT